RILDRLEAIADVLGDVLERLRDPDLLAGTSGELVGAGLREEAVLDVVRLGGRVVLERALDAVVVRDDQAVGRHERSRAATERDDRVERRGEWIREDLRVELDAHLLERLDVTGQRHLLWHPHATGIREALTEPEV